MINLTETPTWSRLLAGGVYAVQSIAGPGLTIDDLSRSYSDGGSSQKLMLFFKGMLC